MSKLKSEKVFATMRRHLAANTARLRGEQGLSFSELARRAGLHWRHLQKIEAGETNATLVTISRVAVGLDVDPVVLLSGGAR